MSEATSAPHFADEEFHRRLLLAALGGAVARWHEAAREASSEAAGFAPLGEALAWAVSLGERIHAKHEPLYAGVAHARNVVLHGYVVVGIYRSIATGAFGSAAFGAAPLGGETLREFLPRGALPAIRPNRANEDGYDSELAGRDVDTVLARVVEDLSKRLAI